jgi:hypothetical protein
MDDRVAGKGLASGGIALLAAALICGACGESAAQTGERNSNPAPAMASRAQAPAAASQASSQQRPGVGSMRYYGGPKSPMWRSAD